MQLHIKIFCDEMFRFRRINRNYIYARKANVEKQSQVSAITSAIVSCVEESFAHKINKNLSKMGKPEQMPITKILSREILLFHELLTDLVIS